MQAAGIVILPPAGFWCHAVGFLGESWFAAENGANGYYWSSTCVNETRAMAFEVTSTWFANLDYLDVSGGNPAAAPIGQFYVGVAGDIVQNFHLRTFVQDKQVLGRCVRGGTFYRRNGPHHYSHVLPPGFGLLPAGEIPAENGQKESRDAKEKAQATLSGAASKHEKQGHQKA